MNDTAHAVLRHDDAQSGSVSNVARHEGYAAALQRAFDVRALGGLGVVRIEVVEQHHALATLSQTLHEVGADEAGATRDEGGISHR